MSNAMTGYSGAQISPTGYIFRIAGLRILLLSSVIPQSACSQFCIERITMRQKSMSQRSVSPLRSTESCSSRGQQIEDVSRDGFCYRRANRMKKLQSGLTTHVKYFCSHNACCGWAVKSVFVRRFEPFVLMFPLVRCMRNLATASQGYQKAGSAWLALLKTNNLDKLRERL